MSNASDLLSIEKVVVPTPIPDPGYPVGPYILHGEVLYKLAHLHKNALTDPKYHRSGIHTLGGMGELRFNLERGS
jgi:hypothetical protein